MVLLSFAAIFWPRSHPQSYAFIQEFAVLMKILVTYNSQLICDRKHYQPRQESRMSLGQITEATHHQLQYKLPGHSAYAMHTHCGCPNFVIRQIDCNLVTVTLELPSASSRHTDHSTPYLHFLLAVHQEGQSSRLDITELKSFLSDPAQHNDIHLYQLPAAAAALSCEELFDTIQNYAQISHQPPASHQR